MSLPGTLLFFGWSTRDARGRRVALSGLIDAWRSGGAKDVDIRLFEAATGEPAPRHMRGWAYWVAPLILSAGFGVRLAAGSGTWFDWVGVAAGVLWLAMQWQNRYAGGSPAMFRDAMLQAARCPACAYSLEGTGADTADGCTVCPECGAAWRITWSNAGDEQGAGLT
jgi:hypothetical protein